MLRTCVLSFFVLLFSQPLFAGGRGLGLTMQVLMRCEAGLTTTEKEHIKRVDNQRVLPDSERQPSTQEPLLTFLKNFTALISDETLSREEHALDEVITIRYFGYERSKKSDPSLNTLLDAMGGVFLIHLGPVIVVDLERFPHPYAALAVTHEFGEFIFRDHTKATVLEFAVARKQEILREYINWLELRHHARFLRTRWIAETDSLSNWFKVVNFLTRREVSTFVRDLQDGKILGQGVVASDTRGIQFSKNHLVDRFLGLSDARDYEAWLLQLPKSLIIAQENLDKRTERILKAVSGFESDALRVIETFPHPAPPNKLYSELGRLLKRHLSKINSMERKYPVDTELLAQRWDAIKEHLQAVIRKLVEQGDPTDYQWLQAHDEGLTNNAIVRDIATILKDPLY